MEVLLVPNYSRAQAVEGARMLARYLEGQGVGVRWVRDGERAPLGAVTAEGADLVVSLGGDGTLLRAAGIVMYSGVPILGLSYGHLGFLTGAGSDHVVASVAAALAGELHVSRRATLSVDVGFGDAEGRAPVEEWRRGVFCLNEMALSRGAMGNLVEFDVSVSGSPIDRLRADGFVVATATGSTGYALSAGGPIVTPEFNGMVNVPVAPHTILARAFLTSPSDVVELSMAPERPVERCVFCDGRLMEGPDGLVPMEVRVSRGPGDIVLLDDDTHGFYRSVSRVFYGGTRS